MVGLVRGVMMSAVAGLLAACAGHSSKPSQQASHQGEASYHALADDHMAHYPLAIGSTSSGAALLDHPAPLYPSAMLASCPADVQLRALLIVGEDGTVDEVRVDQASAIAPAFIAGVRAAALRWRFEPLIISHWAADANDETHPVDTEAKPFSLPYAFRFVCHAGKVAVSSASATSH